MSGNWNNIWSTIGLSNASNPCNVNISNGGYAVASNNIGTVTNINLNNAAYAATAGTNSAATTTYTSVVPNGGYSIGVNAAGTLSGCYTWPTNVHNYNVISNPGALYTNGTLSSGYLQPSMATYAVSISGETGTLLSIHHDGQVEWTGPLSKNVEAFVNALCFNIDKATAGENALARIYRKAIERCLRQIKKMSKEEFIAMLENEVDARMSKAVLISLMEEVPDDE